MPANDLQEALKTIYAAVYTDELTKNLCFLQRDAEGLYLQYKAGFYVRIANPTEDTLEGRAEFARLLVWGLKEFKYLCFFDNGQFWAELIPEQYERVGNTPQEAFLMALAAAIRARAGGGGE